MNEPLKVFFGVIGVMVGGLLAILLVLLGCVALFGEDWGVIAFLVVLIVGTAAICAIMEARGI